MIRITDSFRTTLIECGLSYRQLEEKTGIKFVQFGMYKHRRTAPSRNELDKLCKAFNCKVEDIIEYVEDK